MDITQKTVKISKIGSKDKKFAFFLLNWQLIIFKNVEDIGLP